MKYNKWLLLLLTIGFVACADNEDNTPSFADKDRLETLIDGSIAKISNFRDQYGTYILYDFDKNLDFAYQFEQSSNWEKTTLTSISHDDAEAAVDWLYERLFPLYDDGFKKQFFPRKMLLTADIASASELGLSSPEMGRHAAVANINSVTFAKMTKADVIEFGNNEDKAKAQIAQMNRALMADYLVKARGQFPVGDEFFAYSQSDYASLMNPGRKTVAQILREDSMFFYDHGFFIPEDDEATYFPSAETDIIDYICNMISMDADDAESLFDRPVMASKMHLMATGLKTLGIDVAKVNPNVEQFMTMKPLQPAMMYTKDLVTDQTTDTLEVTIMRGSRLLSYLEVTVNDAQPFMVDLSGDSTMRVVVRVGLDGLHKGTNSVTLKLYEVDKAKPAVVLNTGVSFATMDEVIGINIKKAGDHDEVYRSIKVSQGNGGDVDKEVNANLTTIAFEKHGYLDRYFMEVDAEYRYWKIYRNGTHVEKIITYLRDGFNEDYTAPFYRQTGEYDFKYNDNGELTDVTFTDEKNNSAVIVTDVAYIAGRITRYNYNGKIYDPKYATVDGVTTRVDCLDKDMTGKCFVFTGTEDLNPYYMPELPAVIPGDVAEIPLQLLYSQYLFTSIDGGWNGGWSRDLNYKTNTAEVDRDGVTWTYRFKLK